MNRFRGLAAIVALVVATLSVQVVSAQPALVSSDPPADSVVPTPPDEVRITFDTAIDGEMSSVQIVNATGSTIAEGEADQDDPNSTSMVVDLPDEVPPGDYIVSWTVVGAGEQAEQEVEGEYNFTIDPTATPTDSSTVVIVDPEGTVEPVEGFGDDEDDGGIGRGTLILGAVTIIVAVAVVATVGRRRWVR